MTRATYTPQPGTIPAKVIAYLREQASAGREWVPGAELADHIGQPAVSPYLLTPFNCGAIKRRPGSIDRRQTEYALGDGTPHPKPEPDEPLNPPPEIPKVASIWPGLATPPADTRSRLTIANEHAWASGKQPHRRGKTPDVGAKPGKPPTPTQGATPVKPRKATGPAEYADIDSMQITDDPITPRTASSGDKYGPLFAKMKLGQSIKCRSEDAPKVGNALRKWRDANCPDADVRAVRHYPGDNMGRVWLLEPVKKAA